MKIFKVLFVVIAIFCTSSAILARDYTKLDIKEVKKAQRFAVTNKMDGEYKTVVNNTIPEIKDPHLIQINQYKKISDADFKKKQKADDAFYSQIQKEFKANKSDSYNRQAYSRDFYKIYRVAERIIRANNLGFMNWRIAIVASATKFNASSLGTNCILINSALYDSIADNEDALALTIGHEMAHQLLGHPERKQRLMYYMRWAVVPVADLAMAKKLMMEFRDMEYAADTEGAKLIMKAGYNLDNAVEIIEFINTLEAKYTPQGTHPKARKRIQSYQQNRKYFLDNEWVELGKYNIYNSEPLTVRTSSDRKSIVIGRGNEEMIGDNAYRPETVPQIYTRYAYKAYTNGEFKKSLDYFEKLFELGEQDYATYLYASYDCEYLYKKTGKEKYLEMAKNYANQAKNIAPKNKYVKEQINAL